MTEELDILVDPASATIEKRNIAFTAIVGDEDRKFLLSIADFKAFGVDDPKADPVASVTVISRGLEALIRDRVKGKAVLGATTKLEV